MHPLLEQLGSFDGLVTLNTASTSWAGPAVESYETLAIFLESYRSQILLPMDLPAIQRAFNHASRNETRELIALDLEVARQPVLREFASASQRVGKCQLRRLRPLRDVRVVQRYLTAVEAGRSHAWHTVVYGLTLAVYSLPIRQGLMSYARQTLQGFIHAAARPLRVSEHRCRGREHQLRHARWRYCWPICSARLRWSAQGRYRRAKTAHHHLPALGLGSRTSL